VGEFILEILIIEELVNATLDNWHFKYLVNSWSSCWIFDKHRLNKLLKVV
jgi:hypothetical protein